MPPLEPLSPGRLHTGCDPAELDFDTTEELEDLPGALGQARGMEALEFGVGMERPGYNLYVLGPPGIGKHALTRSVVQRQAGQRPAPSDWCYVNNFDDAQRPHALKLPAGRGESLRQDMVRLVEDLADALPTVFESDEYRTRAREIEGEFKENEERQLKALQEKAAGRDVALLRTPNGFAFAPMQEGEVIKPAVFEKLPDEEKKRIESTVAALQHELQTIIQRLPQQHREFRERVRELNREMALQSTGQRIDEMRAAYGDCPPVLAYLDAVQSDVVENVDDFLRTEDGSQGPQGVQTPPATALHRYKVNVLVSHDAEAAAPVVHEDSPQFHNLLGRIEHQAQMGTLVTDFTLIRPGALHRANGGYLVLEAHKVLTEPFAWEGLKRALFARSVRILSLGEMFSLVSTVSLEPEPIALDVKVALLGDRMIYYLLCQLDQEFRELFKVAADMEEDMERSAESHRLYARFVATLARRSELRPFDREGVAAVIDRAARLADDSQRLSIHAQSVMELIQEADFHAGKDGAQQVSRTHVQAAVDARERRHGRIRERLLDTVRREVVFIDTDGEAVGQVNGLSVLDLGDIRFGQPARITATTRLGDGQVVDIEREAKLGGSLHSKGVLILSGFLGARYAAENPLSLSASLVFEQSYGRVDGDSASAAELCALLSSLAGLPVRQSLAITGSVNQHGRVQPIGGVNEKVEGFFDVCSLGELSGRQGVIIPAANVQHLMLRQDVVEAVAAGRFAVYAVEHVDEAVALLTGTEAGVPDASGSYPEGSVNARVAARLQVLAERRRALAREAHDQEGEA